jgi:predicted flap endonuclease-1-like 5' DNA nuclease
MTSYVTGSFASIFIFGLLTGWLIEWLFYNFFWKSRKSCHQRDKTTNKRQEPAPDNTKNNDVVDQKIEASNNEQTIEQEVKQAEKKPATQKKTAKFPKPDDLTKLLGIGPSMSKRLQEAGINSFKQLSELSTEELSEKLIANGVRTNNKGMMESWANQAKLADANDFDGLKALQNKLKK